MLPVITYSRFKGFFKIFPERRVGAECEDSDVTHGSIRSFSLFV